MTRIYWQFRSESAIIAIKFVCHFLRFKEYEEAKNKEWVQGGSDFEKRYLSVFPALDRPCLSFFLQYKTSSMIS